MTVEELTKYFTYLDGLRISGVTNMFAASSYIASEYNLSMQTSRRILTAWMNSFDDQPPQIRAEQAIEKFNA
jgi:hypothetical protein